VKYSADITQLGGVFILGPGNSCEYSYRSAYGGDTPPVDVLLEFARHNTDERVGGGGAGTYCIYNIYILYVCICNILYVSISILYVCI
jgi:hypothetical protein